MKSYKRFTAPPISVSKTSVKMWLLLLLCLLPCSVMSSDIIHIPDSNQKTLEYYMCTQQGKMKLLPNTILKLSIMEEHMFTPGQFCLLENTTNITITSNSSTILARIRCNSPHPFSILSACGLAFLQNVNLTLSNLHISRFGAALNSNILKHDNHTSLPSFFGTNQSATLFFSHIVNLKISLVNISKYYGFGIVLINSFGRAVIDRVDIHHSLSYKLCTGLKNLSHYNYTCSGSGLLIHSHNIVSHMGQEYYYNFSMNFSKLINSVEVRNSHFHNNVYHNDHFQCITNVFQFQPEKTPIVAGAAVTVYATQNEFVTSTKITATKSNGSIIQQNNGTLSGGIAAIFINTPFTSNLTIQNTIIENNMNKYLKVPCIGTGLLMYVYFTNSYIKSDAAILKGKENFVSTWSPLILNNTGISEHRGYNRSATVYMGMRSQPFYNVQVIFESVGFYRNQAFYTGICMFAETIYEPIRNSKSLEILFKNVVAVGNEQSVKHASLTNSSQFVFYRIGRVTIEGSIPHGSFFSDNLGSVIDAFATEIYLKGMVTFVSNNATQGAAIILRSNSFLVFADNSSVLFQKNNAFLDGGAIYSVEQGTEDNYCIIQIDSSARKISDLNVTVTFDNNHAFRSGQAGYISPFFHCFQTRVHVFPRNLSHLYGEVFHISKNDIETLIASVPTTICICMESENGSYIPKCDATLNFTIFPGDSISVTLSAFDGIGNRVDSQVNASLSIVNDTIHPLHDWHLPSVQEINALPLNYCHTLNYTILSNTIEDGQLNFAVPGLPSQSFAQISLKECPPGFNLEKGECVCAPFLSKYGLKCDKQTKIVVRPANSWFGIIFDNSSNSSTPYVGYANTCPVGYCNSSGREVKITDSHSTICINNREGPLCGNCLDGYSATHGGPECRKCTEKGLALLVGNISSGIITIFVLFLLKLTLNKGTVGGIVFYANTYDIVRTISTSGKPYFIPFVQLVEIINLHQGFSTCLYHGMTYAINFVIQYTYSVYLWLIVISVILVARCSARASRLLMSSSVQVLMTLIHLSFARILFATIDIFKFAPIYTQRDHYIAWFYNGTIHYGTDIHLPLLIVASLSTVFFIIPYVFLALFGSMCLRFRQVNKFRPFIDTIHGPYRDNQRVWYGARIFLLVLLAIMNSICNGSKPFFQLLLQLVLVGLFTILQAYVKPFSHTWMNLLDLWCMVNVMILIVANLYGTYGGSRAEYILFVELIIICITIVSILFYHIYLFAKRLNLIRCCKHSTQSQPLSSKWVPTYQAHTSRRTYESLDSDDGSDYQPDRLRESLLESPEFWKNRN